MRPLSDGGNTLLCANGEYELHYVAPNLWKGFGTEIMVINATVKLVAHASGKFRHGGKEEQEIVLTEQKLHRIFGHEDGYHTDFPLQPPAKAKARTATVSKSKDEE